MTGKIDPTKQYRTRDGREWRYLEHTILGTIVGALKFDDGRWETRIWNITGQWCPPVENKLDLIEVRPRIQRKVWINVCGPFDEIYRTKEEAEQDANYSSADWTEMLEITLDYEPGEGL